jgi:hypothetical protein
LGLQQFFWRGKPADFGTLGGYEKGMKTVETEVVTFRYSP